MIFTFSKKYWVSGFSIGSSLKSSHSYFMPIRFLIQRILFIFGGLFILLSNVQYSSAFNIDTNYSTIYSGVKGSYFGWTVKSYLHQQTPWILIGAPRAQTRQPGVSRGGSVHRCIAGIPQSCQEIIFDPTGSDVSFNGNIMQQADEKSNQWFGHTISVSGHNGAIIMACAPRYVYYSSNFLRREPVGTCFLSTDYLKSFREHSPCRTGKWGYHRQGHCQAGFSAAITNNGRKTYIGAVGSWYWQGQIFADELPSGLSVAKTREGPPSDDDSYMGYATATGEFDGRPGEDLVVGVPRGNNLTGKVVLYSEDLNLLQELRAGMADEPQAPTSDQIGSYFGYSVAVADIDANGLDDVIIGAPFFNELKETKPSAYETGRVYIFYQESKGRFTRSSILNGQKPRGRFGISVASLSDINLDGYKDLVVGAPYDGPKERGAIYIFNGGKKGIIDKHTQVIMAEDISFSLLQFGWSLHGGLDLDRNRYPDLIIGAYGSDSAVTLRARPIITTHIDLKLEPEIISLEDQSCSLVDGTLVACSVVTVCIKYEGIGASPQLDLVIETKLDIGKSYAPRAYTLSNEGSSKSREMVRLVAQTSWCKSSYIYLKKELRDKLTPIMVQVSVTLNEDNFAFQTLKPVLDSLIPSLVKKPLHILKNCGPDNVCIPDLTLVSATPTVPFYKLGGSRGDRTLTLHMTVHNRMEDAYEAQAFIYVPRGVDFVNVDLESDPDNVLTPGGRISCSIRELSTQANPNTANTRSRSTGNDPEDFDERGEGDEEGTVANSLFSSNGAIGTDGSKNASINYDLSLLLDDLLLRAATAPGNGPRLTARTNATSSDTSVNFIDAQARARAIDFIVGNFATLVTCDIGNPLSRGSKIEFDARFYPTSLDSLLRSGHSSMDFLAILNSTNPENVTNIVDNAKLISVPVETESDLVLLGASIPDQIIFPRDNLVQTEHYENETNIGPQVVHVYEVINKGVTSITSAELTILWPSYIRKNNKRLFYLMEKPMVKENKGLGERDGFKDVVCQVLNHNDVNPLGLKIDRFERLKAITNSTLLATDKITQIIQVSNNGEGDDENGDSDGINFRGDNPDKVASTTSRGKRTLSKRSKDLSHIPRLLLTDTYVNPHSHSQRDTHPYLEENGLRKFEMENEMGLSKEKIYLNEITCNTKNCTYIKCLLGKFESGESVSIHLRARVWVDTLIQEQLEAVTVSSKGILKITEVPYSVDVDSIPFKKALVSTYLVSQLLEPQARKVEAWVIILAVTAGIFILCLIGLCLWKFGFFLRKRPPKMNAETVKGNDH